ncbi:MAG: hypothetical protein ABI895_33375 [Deltaproteobacteria bacterium]
MQMARELVKELSAQANEYAQRYPSTIPAKDVYHFAKSDGESAADADKREQSTIAAVAKLLRGPLSAYLRVSGAALTTEVQDSKWKSDEALATSRARQAAEILAPLVAEALDTEINRLQVEQVDSALPKLAHDLARAQLALRRTWLEVLRHGAGALARVTRWTTRDGRDPADRSAVVQLAWENELVLPGEHGYRFFPSFYRHLFDTMKRTPLYDDQGLETHRSALDNLTETSSQVFAGALTSSGLTRKKPRSLEALRRELTKLFQELKFDAADVAKFQGKLFRFMTTSSARRAAEYESMSWWDLLTHGGVSYSKGFEAFLKAAPQALVAMDAETCDARTQGNIVVQLLLDQLLESDYTDSTLVGPTSDAWLEPWRDHLYRQGVCFITGRLVRFDIKPLQAELFGETATVVPELDLELPKAQQEEWTKRILGSDYFVVATDVATAEAATSELARRSLAQVLPGLPRRVGGVPVDLREYVTYVLSKTDMRIKTGGEADWDRLLRERLAVAGFPAEYWGHIRNRDELPAWINYAEEQDLRTGQPRPRLNERMVYGLTKHDRFQTFSGVQFYFSHDLEQARGHVYYFDTEWGLSSISQLQFWQQKTAFRRKGLLGLLSVDIGNFHNRSNFLGKAAHECTKEEIAQEVWRQLSESLRRTRRAKAEETQRLPLPRPVYYHVDDFLFPAEPTNAGRLCTTLTPFLVNNVGDWVNRPGSDPWDPETDGIPADLVDEPQVWQADHGGYQVHYHKIVFAGTYMRTFTRMTTMEAANESARHAVNAILDHLAAVRSVAQKQAAEMYGQWLLDELEQHPGVKSSEAINKVRERLQMPLPLHNIAGEHCKIWNLERYELDELAVLKRVDEALFKKNLPHMADIIGLDGLMASLSPAPSGPEGLLAALVSTIKSDWAIDDDNVLRGAKGAGSLIEKLKEGLGRLTQELGRGNAPP